MRTTVCIIGSGAAGLTLARELNSSPVAVILLEGGGRAYDDRAQDLLRSQLFGLEHHGIHAYRYRMFGGATTRWAGQGLPLLDVDFERRGWVPGSGWPITFQQLEPYYRRAATVMGIEFSPPGAWPSVLPQPPAFDPALLLPIFSQFTERPNFAERFGPSISGSSNVTVILGANVTELVTDPAGTEVQGAVARGLDGHRLEVGAKVFVLCGGGIETPRVMLASDRFADGGIGNANDLVGRYFQDHPGVTVGSIRSSQRQMLSDAFRPRKAEGIKYQPFFRLSPEVMREETLLNTTGSVLFHMRQSPSIDAGKLLFRSLRQRELRGKAPGALAQVMRDPAPLARAAHRYFVAKESAIDPGANPVLTVGCEQAPNPESRIVLATERDALGMKRAALDWRLTTAEIRSWRRAAQITACEFDRLGFGQIEFQALQVPDDPAELSGVAVDIGHHMGTTRMSVSPRDGVVDPDCKVHAIDNLYVASSSVFPTGGFSNPTLTIIALAIRIADKLKERSL